MCTVDKLSRNCSHVNQLVIVQSRRREDTNRLGGAEDGRVEQLTEYLCKRLSKVAI